MTNTNQPNALRELKDGEMCIISTVGGEVEATWDISAGHFCRVRSDCIEIHRPEEVDEWRPASIKF